SDANVVVDVLVEVADRRVAAVGVVPLERQVDVGRLEWLQSRIALRTGAAVDAYQQVEHLAALDVAPTRATDGLAPAGTELQVVHEPDVGVEARQHVVVIAFQGRGGGSSLRNDDIQLVVRGPADT